jgi:hypothetical protein
MCRIFKNQPTLVPDQSAESEFETDEFKKGNFCTARPMYVNTTNSQMAGH